MRGLQEYVATIKRESRNWMDAMAFDVYEFVHELKQGWDELHEVKRQAWEMLDEAKKKGDIENGIIAALLLCKVTDQLLQMDLLLPTVAVPSPSPKVSLQQQQQQQQQSQQQGQLHQQQPQQTQKRYYQCRKGCGQEIYFDENNKSQSGKWISLDKDAGQPQGAFLIFDLDIITIIIKLLIRKKEL